METVRCAEEKRKTRKWPVGEGQPTSPVFMALWLRMVLPCYMVKKLRRINYDTQKVHGTRVTKEL